MAETENIDQLIQEQEGDTDLVRHLRRVIREKNSRLTEVETKLSTTTKESAFKDLGIDTSKGTGKLLFERYDGEPEPEKIREFATGYGVELGAGQPAGENPPPGQDPAGAGVPTPHPDAAAAAAIDGATGDPTPAPGQTDPLAEATKAYNEILRTTGNQEMGMAAHFEAQLAASIAAQKEKRA